MLAQILAETAAGIAEEGFFEELAKQSPDASKAALLRKIVANTQKESAVVYKRLMHEKDRQIALARQRHADKKKALRTRRQREEALARSKEITCVCFSAGLRDAVRFHEQDFCV